jgi:hypothetical protein
MSLSKEDLQKIKQFIDTGNELIKVRIDNLESHMQKGFIEVDLKLEEHDVRFDQIESKINQLVTMENEDILSAFKEIKILKSRVKKLESKIYSE